MSTPSANPFGGRTPDFGSQVFTGWFSITAGTALPFPPRAIYVGGAGNINMTGVDGVAVTFVGCFTGQVVPCSPTAVNSSGTTATAMIGLY